MSDAAEQVEEWADEVYEKLGKETTWAIAQVKCPEEGCPPVETILTDLSVKGPKPGNGVYKIFKPMNEVTKGDVEAALCGRGGGHAGGHGAGHGGGHDGGHSGGRGDGHGHAEGDGSGCCEGHGDGHGHGGGHGHSEGHGD